MGVLTSRIEGREALDQCLSDLKRDDSNDREITESSEVAKKEANISDLCEKMKRCRQEGNYAALLHIEKVFIEQDLNRCLGKTPANNADIAQAWKSHGDFFKGIQAFDKLHERPHDYNKSIDTYETMDKDGLPKDAFRQYIASQKAKLENLHRAPILDIGNKDIYQNRIMNLELTTDYYKIVQKEVGEVREETEYGVTIAESDKNYKASLAEARRDKATLFATEKPGLDKVAIQDSIKAVIQADKAKP